MIFLAEYRRICDDPEHGDGDTSVQDCTHCLMDLIDLMEYKRCPECQLRHNPSHHTRLK